MNNHIHPIFKAALDAHIMGNPFKKEMPDYWEIARGIYQTKEDMFDDWLKIDTSGFMKAARLKGWDDEMVYDYLCEEHRGIIETKFIGEL